ncbi:hypothetical protein NKH61_34705 [Mesorhizobium sp. M1005]|uniref:serine O-acetyltransferase n=1 Tax=unclassified Mesorhizobium TaxID=325217 RepID=UPI003334EE75
MILRLLTAPNSTRLRWHLHVMSVFQDRGLRLLARYTAYRIQRRFGIYVAPTSKIARSVVFPHPTGIVIGEGVIVHDRTKIFQNVTLGGARIGDQEACNYPEIGSDTVIFAGAVVVGNVRIGANCVIGANSVVLTHIPDNSVAVGVPARIVRTAVTPTASASFTETRS